jgi:two-component system phosphate regulon sensor histidine kinase PhoR
LLESSSIEAGRFVLRHQLVDLDQVIDSAAQVVQPLLERRRQTLAVSEPAFLPPLVGDAARLTQVLVNLLGNASKYSPMDAPIDLEVTRQGSYLRVAVADRGPGIPREERETLFRRFVRGHAGTGEQYGIGLGLYVVKSAVEAHQGRVGVDDYPGGGSLFWFELPIAETSTESGT